MNPSYNLNTKVINIKKNEMYVLQPNLTILHYKITTFLFKNNDIDLVVSNFNVNFSAFWTLHILIHIYKCIFFLNKWKC